MDLFMRSFLIRASIQTVFYNIVIADKFKEWYPEIYVQQSDEKINKKKLREEGYDYVLKLKRTYQPTFVSGIIASLKKNLQYPQEVEFKLERDELRKWTRVTIVVHEPNSVPRHILFGIPVGSSLVVLFESGLIKMQQAYAASSVSSSTSGMIISNKLIFPVFLSVLVLAGGIYLGNVSESETISVPVSIPTDPVVSPTLIMPSTEPPQNSGEVKSYAVKDPSSSTFSDNITQQTQETVESKQSILDSLLGPKDGFGIFGPPVVEQYSVVIPKGLFIDNEDNLYAADIGSHSIQKYGPGGNFVSNIGENSIVPVSYEYSIYSDVLSHMTSLFVQYAYAAGALYCNITTGEGCIDPDGLGPLGVGDGQFYKPHGVTLDNRGNVFVADWNNHRIQKFDSDGNFLMKFGIEGVGDGQFKFPGAVAVNSGDGIYVADTWNHRIQKFDANGEFLMSFGQEDMFNTPYGLAIDDNDDLFVADTRNHRIQKFDANGEFLMSFGSYCDVKDILNCVDPDSDGPLEYGDGQFNQPIGIVVDNAGNIYVADTKNHRIQKFDANGEFVQKIGELGSTEGQFSHPWGIAIDSSSKVFVSERDNRRIQTISFDSVTQFIDNLDDIACNTPVMINDPLPVPDSIRNSFSLHELLYEAEKRVQSEQFTQSLRLYYIASQIKPDSVNAWNGIGYSQTFLCSQYNNSPLIAYNHVLGLSDNNENALIGIGYFYEIRKFIPEAILYYTLVLDMNPNSVNAANGLASVHLLDEEYQSALDAFKISFHIDDTRITTHNGIAYAYFKLEQYGSPDGALYWYQSALNLDEDNLDALHGLYAVYMMTGQASLADDTQSKINQLNVDATDNLIE